ncbi:ABC transporter permease [Streptomyces sp. NPDC091219]|uniref:ABC transporter permease n=1 Tax=Streptomyces sp. NPDC091219 TaxID=3155193 RepID=UPI00344DA73E
MSDSITRTPARRENPVGVFAKRTGLIHLSGIYVLVLVVLFFWQILRPGVWLSLDNVEVILSQASVVGLLALAAVLPMSAGLLDISFANIAGFSMGLTASLALHTSINPWLLALISIGLSALFGLVSGLLVALLELPSLIVTLGMSSIALAITQLLLDGQTLYPRDRLPESFIALGSSSWGLLPISAAVLMLLALVAWLWTEHTPSGRRLLAVGGNPAAARLAGVGGKRYQIAVLTLSATISGVAGVILLATIGTADDVSSAAYLLPVFAAVFVGSTQIKSRFNVAGTVLAVILIQTGIHGIELSGLDHWVNHVFNGAVLVVAVVISRGSRKYAF